MISKVCFSLACYANAVLRTAAKRENQFLPCIAVGLLLLHVGLFIGSMGENFVTVDESGHVPSGLAHWHTGSFAPYRVNPPLARMLATLPLALAGVGSDSSIAKDAPGLRPEWKLGKELARTHAADFFELFWVARWAGLFWSLLGALVIFLWARDLYGGAAGCLGLALWCLEPNVLAHASVVTADIPATVLGLLAGYLFWRYLKQPSWGRAWWCGVLLGLAQLAKFTLLLLYPLWLLLAVIFWWGRSQGQRGGRLGQGLLILGLSLLTINIGYGFEKSGQRLGSFTFVSELFGGDLPEKNRFRDTICGYVIVPVPGNYLAGIDQQRLDFESGWPKYLGGEWRKEGWWYFYFYAFGVKLPLGTLLFVLGGMVLALVRRKGDWRNELACWLPAFSLLLFVSMQTGLQYFRYALPVLPFLFIGASQWATVKPAQRRTIPVFVMAAVLWIGWNTCAVYPHYLGYFNEIAGGPEGGADFLLDSHVDWGRTFSFLRNGSNKTRKLGPWGWPI